MFFVPLRHGVLSTGCMRGKLWGSFSYCQISTSCLNIIEKGSVILKGFPVIPKSAHKVIIVMEIYHIKLCLTFGRAPCMPSFGQLTSGQEPFGQLTSGQQPFCQMTFGQMAPTRSFSRRNKKPLRFFATKVHSHLSRYFMSWGFWVAQFFFPGRFSSVASWQSWNKLELVSPGFVLGSL